MRRHSLRSKFPHIFGGWHKMTAGKRLHAERFFKYSVLFRKYSVLFRWRNGGQRIAADGRKNRLAVRRTFVCCKYYRGGYVLFQDGFVILRKEYRQAALLAGILIMQVMKYLLP